MQLDEIEINNYRSLKSLKIKFENLTIFLGPNNAGKSSAINAIDSFFNPNNQYYVDDFYNRECSNDIIMEVTFKHLSKKEQKCFSSFIFHNELKIRKIITFDDNKSMNTYSYLTLKNSDFSLINKNTSADVIAEEYSKLQKTYTDLPNVKSKSDRIKAVEDWELKNAEKCKPDYKEYNFFDSKKPETYIPSYINFLKIPANVDTLKEATESKNSYLTDILNLTVRDSLTNSKEMKNIKTNLTSFLDNFSSTGQLKNIQDDISNILSKYSPDTYAKIKFNTEDINMINLIKASAFLSDDGFESSVDLHGNGTQRAFIMALLEYLANTKYYSSLPEINSKIILAIEEPEIFQHPSRQRNIRKMLSKLTDNDSNFSFQVIYTTHSSLMISVENLDSIRRFYKIQTHNKPKITKIEQTNMDDIVSRFNDISDNKINKDLMLSKLLVIVTPWMYEGFFADTVVLVEGDEDRAIILGIAEFLQKNLSSLNISVIPCRGKENISRPYILFSELNIPVYAIWDSDKDKKSEKDIQHSIKVNRLLQELYNEKDIKDFPEKIDKNYSCFKENITKKFKNIINSKCDYNKLLKKYESELGISEGNGKKNTYIIKCIINEATKNGIDFSYFNNIITNILELNK